MGGERRDQIVAAAAELFAEAGYHGASMRDIGFRVGLLKGSLYAHVANKRELLLEIASTAARGFAVALDPICRTQAPAPVKLRQALRAHCTVLAEFGAVAAVYRREVRHLDGQPAAWERQVRQRYEALWVGIFEQGCREGTFRADLDAPAATALALAGAWAAVDGTLPVAADPIVYADCLCDLLLEGCGNAAPYHTAEK